MVVDGEPVPGGLFDFGLFFFHNAKEALSRGTGPYFYLPKMESHLEARLWNDVFVRAQERLGVPRGSIKATCLIETLPAAFEMDEFLWELREHSAGLNCGRWDYIFSFIKKRAEDPSAVLPDRSQVTMDKAFLAAYVKLLIKTCHRRGIHAMGGMAAQIPIKDDPAANEAALEKVRADKLREVKAGHDGTWVAHPGLVPIAREIFDAHMAGSEPARRPARGRARHPGRPAARPRGPAHRRRPSTQRPRRSPVPRGMAARKRLRAALQPDGRRGDRGDLAGAGLAMAPAQDPRRRRRRSTRSGSRSSSRKRCSASAREVGDARFDGGRFPTARALFVKLSTTPKFEDFLTLPAYDLLASPVGDASAPESK